MPAKKKTTTKTTARSRMLDQAAEKVRERLGLDTLATRNSDGLAFHDLSVASIRDAIQIAFDAGYAAAGGKPTAQPTDSGEMLDTLQIKKIERRTSAGGAWVTGTIAGHDFSALVFPEHAAEESYELDHSRISKLWIQEHFTHRQVAAFERGWDVRPTTDAAQQITDLLSAGLAETVYGK